MKVAVAGATGVLGRALIPLLVEAGYSVRGLVRSPDKARRSLPPGIEMVEGDLLGPVRDVQVRRLVEGCDAVLHIATSIPRDPAAPGAWDANTRLRIEGTEALLAAARDAGCTRYLQQSITMAYADGGDAWLDETAPLDTSPGRAGIAGTVARMEALVRDLGTGHLQWCILRGALFVGPGTGQEQLIERLRAGQEAVACDGRAFVSLIHLADMAAAVAAALARAPDGSVFNIVDEPLRAGDYLDRLAAVVGAPRPRRDPALPCPPSWRCSNAAARSVLHWSPTHPLIPPLIPTKL
jgi:nucleoside-diphosphate-sugar epimerase